MQLFENHVININMFYDFIPYWCFVDIYIYEQINYLF